MRRHLVRVRRIFRRNPFTAVEALLLGVMLAGVGAAGVLDKMAPLAADRFVGRILLVTVGGGVACMVLALIAHTFYDVWRVVRNDVRPVPQTRASRLRFVWRILETISMVLWILWVALVLWTVPDLPDNEQAGGFAFMFLFIALIGVVFLVFLAAVRIVVTVFYRTRLRGSRRSQTDRPDGRATVDDSSRGGTEPHGSAGGGTEPSREENILQSALGDSYPVAKRRLLAGTVGAAVLGTLFLSFRELSGLAPLALFALLTFLAGTLCALGLLLVVVGHARYDLARSGTADGPPGGPLAVVARVGRGVVETVAALVFAGSSWSLVGTPAGQTAAQAGFDYVVFAGIPLLLLGVVWGLAKVVYRGLRAFAGAI